MVMPLADDNSDRRLFPYVNLTLIALNVIVFAFFQDFGRENNRFTYTWSTVPYEIVTGEDAVTEPRTLIVRQTGDRVQVPGLEPTPISVYLTLLTSLFMHGSIMHILGNMLFLYIFGDNVEDALGHVRYLSFYLLAGILASLSHVFVTVLMHGADSPEALVPSLGASGAISGVLGGYIVLYPYRRVTVLLFRILTEVPAFVAIGMWFVFQLISSLSMFGGKGMGGGVAYAAHIGGFLFGVVLIKPFLPAVHPADAALPSSGDRVEPW